MKNHWRAQLQSKETGQISERDVFCAWDPKKEYVPELVALAAAAELSQETKKQHVGLTAVLMEEE